MIDKRQILEEAKQFDLERSDVERFVMQSVRDSAEFRAIFFGKNSLLEVQKDNPAFLAKVRSKFCEEGKEKTPQEVHQLLRDVHQQQVDSLSVDEYVEIARGQIRAILFLFEEEEAFSLAQLNDGINMARMVITQYPDDVLPSPEQEEEMRVRIARILSVGLVHKILKNHHIPIVPESQTFEKALQNEYQDAIDDLAKEILEPDDLMFEEI